MPLNTNANIARIDDFYQELIDMHRDLSEAQSMNVNAKLILLLANHIGDNDILHDAIKIAKDDL